MFTAETAGVAGMGGEYRTLTLLVLFVCFLSQALSQSVGLDQPHIYYPCPLPAGEWQKSLGLAIATLPKDIVEEEMNQSPAIDFHSRIGIPWSFSVDGRILAQILTNHIAVGFKWSHAFDRFAFSVGYDVAWWFGFLTIDGFDNTGNGWLNYPNVSAGYNFDDFLITLKAEAVLVMSYSTYAGENKIASDKNTFGGLSFSFVMEQPFWKNNHVTLSFKASYLRFFYQAWFTYETFDRFLFIPELSLGFLL